MSEVGSNSSAEEISPEEIEEIQVDQVSYNLISDFVCQGDYRPKYASWPSEPRHFTTFWAICLLYTVTKIIGRQLSSSVIKEFFKYHLKKKIIMVQITLQKF